MKIGIVTPKLDTSQAGLCITLNLNKLCEKYNGVEASVFVQEYGKFVVSPNFPVMQIRDAWGFNGILISTNIDTTKFLYNIPGPSKKFLYVWELEWMSNNHTHEELSEIYQNKEIELIGRSKHYNTLITNLWKPPIDIMENFNYEKLIELYRRYGK